MTVQEAIKHCEEKAKEKYAEGMLCHANPNDDLLDGCIQCAKEHEQLAEWLKELEQYRALEEQGLLLKLPCKVGDTVFCIDWYWDCKYENYCPNEDTDCGNFRCEHEVKKYFIKETEFEIQMIYQINETVFLTKEEAEAKLKEMESE